MAGYKPHKLGVSVQIRVPQFEISGWLNKVQSNLKQYRYGESIRTLVCCYGKVVTFGKNIESPLPKVAYFHLEKFLCKTGEVLKM